MKLWIARDKSGNLSLFNSKPELLENGEEWNNEDNVFSSLDLDTKEFEEVTFENSPKEVEIKLINKEDK